MGAIACHLRVLMFARGICHNHPFSSGFYRIVFIKISMVPGEQANRLLLFNFISISRFEDMREPDIANNYFVFIHEYRELRASVNSKSK